MRLLLFSIFFGLILTVKAQGPHSQLIFMTQQEAEALSTELHLSSQDARTLSTIYVNHAMQVEDLIVDANPEINLLKEIKALDKIKVEQVKNLLSDEDFKLYEYKKEQSEIREASEFDSLQIHLNDPEFNNAVIEYFDDNVSPYLIYYYHTYFKPALKQKHYFKINQERKRLSELEYKIDSIKEISGVRYSFDSELSEIVEKTLKDLKRLRKKYQERLDYINVAMGPVAREWNNDYIMLVQEHYKDDAFQRIDDYGKYLNAYGINYVVGEFSLLLFDIYYPRGYVEGRNILIEILEAAKK